MGNLVEHGLYKINPKYFQDFRGKDWKDSKNGNRPYYFAFRDNEGTDWLIPLSNSVELHREKIKKEEAKRGEGNCVYYHIGEIASQERVFLIGDMFPVSDEYIVAPWTLSKQHYVVQNQKLNAEVRSKAMRYLKLVETGVMKSRNDIMEIKRQLNAREKK